MSLVATRSGPVNLSAVDQAVELTIGGYGSIGIVAVGTFTATLAFEASIDGTTWGATNAIALNGSTTVQSATAAGQWMSPAAGLLKFRVRVSAYTSGLATVSLFVAGASTTSLGTGGGGGGGGAVTVADGADVAEGSTTDVAVTGDNAGTLSAKLRGLSKMFASVWDSGNNWLKVSIQNATLAVTQSGTWTVQPGNTANTTAWKVDGSAVTQPVSGTVTASNVTGNVAQDLADSGNPVKVGAKAVSALAGATLVSAADRTDAVADLDQAVIVRDQIPLGDLKTDATSNTDGASTASSVFTAVASTKNYVCAISVFRTDTATTTQYIDFRDGTGGSVLWRMALPAGGGSNLASDVPLFKTSANTALAYDVSAALTTVYINVTGFQSKVA